MRHNLHLLKSIKRNDCVVIVDSTRSGKRYPDSMSKTIPIWCAVLNSALQLVENCESGLFLPYWVPLQERDRIIDCLPEFVDAFKSTFDFMLDELRETVIKPLRVIWLRPESHWSIEQCNAVGASFHAVFCLSVSLLEEEVEQTNRRGWHYIQGAGDDEENWVSVNGVDITPRMLWKYRELFVECIEQGGCLQDMVHELDQSNDCLNVEPLLLDTIDSLFQLWICKDIIRISLISSECPCVVVLEPGTCYTVSPSKVHLPLFITVSLYRWSH